MVINITADMEERFQCAKETQERAIASIQEARTKYEKASDNDLRNRYKQLRSFRTGDLVLRKTKDESVERKFKPTYGVKPYVVVATGERGNYAIQAQRKVNSHGKLTRGVWVHDPQGMYPERLLPIPARASRPSQAPTSLWPGVP